MTCQLAAQEQGNACEVPVKYSRTKVMRPQPLPFCILYSWIFPCNSRGWNLMFAFIAFQHYSFNQIDSYIVSTGLVRYENPSIKLKLTLPSKGKTSIIALLLVILRVSGVCSPSKARQQHKCLSLKAKTPHCCTEAELK